MQLQLSKLLSIFFSYYSHRLAGNSYSLIVNLINDSPEKKSLKITIIITNNTNKYFSI